MRRLLFGDRKLRVRDEGESNRCPVVMIHGAGCSSVVWLEVLKRVATVRRVVAPDLPGHGQSDPWHEQVSVDGYRDAVGAICASLEIPRAILVGHSMGVAIALRLALAYPEKVAGLVLVAGAARFAPAAAFVDGIAQNFDRFPELMAEMGYSPSTPRDRVDRWTSVLSQATVETTVADFRALDGFDERARLPELSVPSLVLGGSDDLLTPPKRSHELAAGIPKARVQIIPHAGHFLFHEQLEAFHAALDPFLAELP